MSRINGFGRVAIFASLAASSAACATQSSAFRQMSAAEHEGAARSATPSEAKEHLDAAGRLREDQRSACFEVPDADRIRGPFAHAGDVASVTIVRDRGPFPKGPLQPVGIAVNLRPQQGMTQQWLGRVVACHAAYAAVVGHEARPSPLSVPNAQVAVTTAGGGFRVTVTSHDPDAVRSVLEKGQELAEESHARLD